MAITNFLQKLVKTLAPNIFRPVPTGVLYVMLQSISREISGICPWDTGESCYLNHSQYWSVNCRNMLCPGYRHPLGLIAYTSRSSTASSVDNRFDYSSFKYLSVTSTGDWLPVGTLGAEVLFDFGDISDVGGFGSGYFGTRYWGDNSYSASGIDVHIGDKWYIDCHVDTGAGLPTDGAVDAPYPDGSNLGHYNAMGARGTYTGDHNTTYTIELIDFWGYEQNYENALLQINLSTCTDEWLDFWGAYFGLARLLLVGGYETDSAYRERILKEITRAKGTRAVLLEEAKTYFGSDLVTITEYANTSSGPPSYIRWDGPAANGLWPWEFYINLPTQKSPSSKFVKCGGRFKGTWAIGTTYTQMDSVTYGLYSYVSLENSNLGKRPDLYPAYWKLMNDQGVSGLATYFEEAGEIYVYEGGTGYYYPYGTFHKLPHVSPDGGLGGDWCFSMPTNVGDCLLFGCLKKFSGVRFVFTAPGILGTYVWEYWNGTTWVTLASGTTMRDTTNSLRQNGGVHWLVPETGWKISNYVQYNIPSTVSDLYWVRCRVIATPTTTPYADQIAVLHAGSTNRGAYIATQDVAISGKEAYTYIGIPPAPVSTGYLHQPKFLPVVAINNGGAGYKVGDVLDIIQAGAIGATLIVTSVAGGVVNGISLYTAGTGYAVAGGLSTSASSDFVPSAKDYFEVDTGEITINVAAAGGTFTRTDVGSYLSDGFAPGDTIYTKGFTNAGNNTTKIISTIDITGKILTVTIPALLVNETGGGNERINTHKSATVRVGSGCKVNITSIVTGVPLVSVYVPDSPHGTPYRDRNDIYIYREVSFAKPVWETGLQAIIDRLKTAGTIAIINPMD